MGLDNGMLLGDQAQQGGELQVAESLHLIGNALDGMVHGVVNVTSPESVRAIVGVIRSSPRRWRRANQGRGLSPARDGNVFLTTQWVLRVSGAQTMRRNTRVHE